ncbi:MAG TPA: hypothetical protein VNY05_14945 [Candidatus Acidoferrales bacterium]|jgi:hypothetical protein|nr:hypothetical protein [Candidatus Acidoferrales bacterium]
MAGVEWKVSQRQNEPEAANEILRYFLDHPEAADTLEGLAHWRLIERDKRLTMEHVAEALEWLVARGYLKQMSKPYSGRIYSLDREDRAKVELFLEMGETE